MATRVSSPIPRTLQVYVVYFKTNRNFIHEFPNMGNYVKDLYSNPGARSAWFDLLYIRLYVLASWPKCSSAALSGSCCS